VFFTRCEGDKISGEVVGLTARIGEMKNAYIILVGSPKWKKGIALKTLENMAI
jgi:hypothetical protein